jgi:large subunit ribosomal protein L4
MEAKVYNQTGKEVGTVKLPENVFGVSWNADMVHQVVTSMLQSARKPIAHTKTRGEVSGGGKKPWRQKGTGRARHGSIRSPLWVGGGVTHGPRNEKIFYRKVNKKTKTKALYAILSKKLADNELIFVDRLKLEAPKTKNAVGLLSAISGVGFDKIVSKPKNALRIALAEKDSALERGFSNISNVSIGEVRNLNPVDALNHKHIMIVDPEKAIGFFDKKSWK